MGADYAAQSALLEAHPSDLHAYESEHLAALVHRHVRGQLGVRPRVIEQRLGEKRFAVGPSGETLLHQGGHRLKVASLERPDARHCPPRYRQAAADARSV